MSFSMLLLTARTKEFAPKMSIFFFYNLHVTFKKQNYFKLFYLW